MDNDSSIDSDVLAELFVDQVKDVLKHIYDLSYLGQHPLTRQVASSLSGETVGQRLRRELVAAIDTLNPGPDVPFRAPRARLHSPLVLHYLEQMTIQETANQLGLSERQALRNLREAEYELATILWSRRSAQSSEEATAVRLSSLDAEMVQLASAPRLVDLSHLLQEAQMAIGPRLTQRKMVVQDDSMGYPITLSTNMILAQQLLISLLNYCVGQARKEGCLTVILDGKTTPVTLVLRYEPESTDRATPIGSTINHLAESLGWTVTQQDLPGTTRQVTCTMVGHCMAVLIIDDNQGLVSLLQRYLTNLACRVIIAANGQEGLRLAQETTPDAILLDVMMPGMQGWEVLQRLHNDPVTAAIPVIICSVINEPELAQALGAKLFLPKPIRQADVLAALHQLSLV